MKNKYSKVLDGAHRKIRGLWKRNDSFYLATRIQDPLTGLKKDTLIRLEGATDFKSARLQSEKLKEKISEGETIYGRQGPAFNEYRQHYIKTSHKKPKTLYNEDYFLRAWERFLGETIKIGTVSKQNVLAFRNQLKENDYSPRTINLHVVSLRNLFKLAKIEGYVKTMPVDGVTQIKVVHKERILLPSTDIELICNEAITNHKRNGEQFADFIRLMAYCGGRTSEVLLLNWADVDFKNRVLIFKGEHTKNSQTRRVDFNPKLQAHLETMNAKRTSDNLFPSTRTDNPITSFKSILRKIRADLGMPELTNHLLRHYFISMCIMSNVDYLTISKWVGHKDGGVLIGKVYGHLNSEHTALMGAKVTFTN